MNTCIKTILFTSTLCFLFLATPVFSAEIRVDTNRSEIRSGEQFSVDVIMHSDESLNAIEGRLEFPVDKLEVVEIPDGKSILNFWVEKPHIESPGVMVFSGITPGGFSGANKNVFSVVFEAKDTGLATVLLKEVRVLENDGLGTQLTPLTRDSIINIKAGDSSSYKEVMIDTELPEDFTPSIEKSLNLFDGKSFLVFATQDKRSGIDHYEVREGKWDWFRNAESPYLLKNQSLDKEIFIKAIDKNGNERLVIVEPKYSLPWYRSNVFFGILLTIVIVGFITRRSWLKFI